MGSGARELSSVLGAVADELAAARQTGLALQDAVHGLIGRAGEMPAHMPMQLQDLDRLTQLLGELSGFLGALAGAAPEELMVETSEALSALRLRDLAARLSGAMPASCIPVDDGGGDLDLFE